MMVQDSSFFINGIVSRKTPVQGKFIDKAGELFYQITNYDCMKPFFITLTSSGNHWIFISSTGGITAGVMDRDQAVFPYNTEDKIQENYENTGSKTIARIESEDGFYVWEPFSDRFEGCFQIERHLFKNIPGNKIIFQEINRSLNLVFELSWTNCPEFGIVKKSKLINSRRETVKVSLLDGVQNILPSHVDYLVQNGLSNLLDAYKRSELVKEAGLGLFTFSASLSDKPEPSESLEATTWWHRGLDPKAVLLSSAQLKCFRKTGRVHPESDIKGARGAFFIQTDLVLEKNQERSWLFCGEVSQNHLSVHKLIARLGNSRDQLINEVNRNIEESTIALEKIVGNGDGIQHTGSQVVTCHHFTNVLFNIMRGGYFAHSYGIYKEELLNHIFMINKDLFLKAQGYLSRLPDIVSLEQHLNYAAGQEDRDLKRILEEFLPLTYSRRHGDPSRPWNKFKIDTKKNDGSPKIGYEGNWRDIFQNWEALLRSYPLFVFPVITRFLNAMTADGYNPYRVSDKCMEWEKPDSEDPWSNIGYWSDHQIIYLEKLLEIAGEHFPGRLEAMLHQDHFVFLDIPYEIKSFEEILKDSSNTIDFNLEKDERIEILKESLGADACLLHGSDGKILHASLMEKLLVPLLAKMTNFIPDGGIWMNTQRPEWNDANNALVGAGMSMVTLFYMTRYVEFLLSIIPGTTDSFPIHKNILSWFSQVEEILNKSEPPAAAGFDNKNRFIFLEMLGRAGSMYREKLYREGLSPDLESVKADRIRGFLDRVGQVLGRTVEKNLRPDGLFHSYNRLYLKNREAEILTLYEMLEGQVAALSTRAVDTAAALGILSALKKSGLYREDQNSYLLYPNRELKGYLEKNTVTITQLEKYPAVKEFLASGKSALLMKSVPGTYHFNRSFKNRDFLEEAMEKEEKEQGVLYSSRVKTEMGDLYEEVFNHRSFTGRSGTFFAYEGLGSIYWHMVAKLLLAVQERVVEAYLEQDENSMRKLRDAYFHIRKGIGFNKSPREYGAFPTDPYSHTPLNSGAKQPGLTGQVKEEVITRIAEMGIIIKKGQILFSPVLIDRNEFLPQPDNWSYYDVSGIRQNLILPKESFGYTFCNVPILVRKGGPFIVVHYNNGTDRKSGDYSCSPEDSQSVFLRTGKIRLIEVSFDFSD